MSAETGRPVSVSVLIATHNRASLLDRMLGRLANQTLARSEWEIVVVDNESADDTQEVIRRWTREIPLKTATEAKPGKNNCMNKALELASGELLVFTDDDVYPAPNWLQEYWRALREWPKDVVFGGPVIPEYPPTTPEWLQKSKYAPAAFARFELDLKEGQMPKPYAPFGPNYAVRASAIPGMKFCPYLGPRPGKSYAAGGETEFLSRLRVRDVGFIYVPTAVVRHHVGEHQFRLEWLFRRAFSFGRGSAFIPQIADRLSGRRLLGAPVGLYFQIAVATALYGFGALLGKKARFETGALFHFLRGHLYQLRLGVQQYLG